MIKSKLNVSIERNLLRKEVRHTKHNKHKNPELYMFKFHRIKINFVKAMRIAKRWEYKYVKAHRATI